MRFRNGSVKSLHSNGGSSHAQEEEPNHRESQVQILGANPQVWSQSPQNRGASEAVDIDNGNNLWWQAITKEMMNVRPAFEVWEKETSELPVGYTEITCHMIFDV